MGRIDGAYGDRNLVCSCPPPEAFEEAAASPEATEPVSAADTASTSH